MSHFTRIRTKLIDRAKTIQAFADLGYTVIESSGPVRGYRNGTVVADMRVQATGLYDIGIQTGTDGYELVADWSMLHMPTLVPRLQQRYAYHVTREKLEEQGFNLVEEQQGTDGRLHLTLRRMA